MKDYATIITALEMDTAYEAADAIRELSIAAKRYETVRRMNPMQFMDLYRANIEQGIPFDDLVDNAGVGA